MPQAAVASYSWLVENDDGATAALDRLETGATPAGSAIDRDRRPHQGPAITPGCIWQSPPPPQSV